MAARHSASIDGRPKAGPHTWSSKADMVDALKQGVCCFVPRHRAVLMDGKNGSRVEYGAAWYRMVRTPSVSSSCPGPAFTSLAFARSWRANCDCKSKQRLIDQSCKTHLLHAYKHRYCRIGATTGYRAQDVGRTAANSRKRHCRITVSL